MDLLLALVPLGAYAHFMEIVRDDMGLRSDIKSIETSLAIIAALLLHLCRILVINGHRVTVR